jgi:hypothetical protein
MVFSGKKLGMAKRQQIPAVSNMAIAFHLEI